MAATVVGVEIAEQQIRVAVKVETEGELAVMLSIVMPQSATLQEVVAEGKRLLALRRSLIGQSVEA